MSSAPIPWKHIRNVLVLFAPLWLGAVAVFGLIGVSYALLAKDIYAARQPLVVRDEATRAVDRLGRFASQTELKAAQETILEMTQNREVVAGAFGKSVLPTAASMKRGRRCRLSTRPSKVPSISSPHRGRSSETPKWSICR